MRVGAIDHRLMILIAALVLLGAGCRQYEIEVVLRADGSGTRTLQLRPDLEADLQGEPSQEVFAELFCLHAENGWSRSREESGRDAPDVIVYRRDEEVTTLGRWRDLSGDLCIRGAAEPGAYDSVRFENRITVHASADAKTRSYTYRERFAWRGLREILVARQAEAFCNRLQAIVPSLTDGDRRALTGLLAGALLANVQLEPSAGDQDAIVEVLTRSVAVYAAEILHRHDPEAPTDSLRQIASEAILDPGGDLEAFLRREMPGAYLAGATSISVSVTVPGLIVDTNADRVEGRTVSWNLDTWDALVRPVELYVRSEIAD